MSREEYIKGEIDKALQFWISWALFSAALFFIVIAILDYIATPENFADFLKYRLIGACIFIYLIILNRKKVNRKYQLSVLYIALLIGGSIIEYMILHFGGHTSTYYAGFFLAAMYCLGFVPLNPKHSMYFSILALLMYAIPILLFDKSINYRYFSMPLFFLVSIFSSVVIWRYVSQQRLISELGLQYDIGQQKKQLEVYSTQLESLVLERTKKLHESEQWHRSLFENATDGIVVLDKNGVIVNANGKACEMHGFNKETLVGTHIKLLEQSENKEIIAERQRRILAGESLVFETRHNKKDGTPLDLEISAKAITVGEEMLIQSFYRDITEKKKLHEHMCQSQKMDSIGVLAGGIAHDFNNILTAILGHAEIIRRYSVLDVKATNSLGVIEDASRRAGRMISKLLGFARKSKYEIVALNLNDVVYDTLKLLERVVDKNIELTVELDSHLPHIQGDANQIEQIAMNLIINARDAMPRGGKIAIKTAVVDVKQGMQDVPAYIVPGEYVMFTLSDTGTGIPKEVVSRIFEPFFTTKERGKGTGLGLSMVYGAVKEHKGYITVSSELGVGTLFTIYLPSSRAAALAPAIEPSASLSGDETLLIVDDEEVILTAVQEALTSHGYKVIAISDSPNALKIFQKIPQEIALVITDIAMPHMDGKELIKKIKEVKPEVKIIAMSGHAKYIADKDGIREIDGFLKKPFESPYLLSVVRRILDAKARPALTI